MSADNEKCINPWFGLFFIVLVCIMIAAAILFESKESRQIRRMRHKAIKKTGTQVNFTAPPGETNAAADKLIF